MLYELAHIVKDKFPFLWDIVEWSSGVVFSLRYRKRLKTIGQILDNHQGEYKVVPVSAENAAALAEFFAAQPEEAFKFFRPHDFDEKGLKKLVGNKGFLSYIVMKDSQVVGYFFLRCYFMGKCYRGKMTDYRWQGKGIGKLMGVVATDIARSLGLRMYASINKDNVASFMSSKAVNNVKIIEEKEDGDMIIEYLEKPTYNTGNQGVAGGVNPGI